MLLSSGRNAVVVFTVIPSLTADPEGKKLVNFIINHRIQFFVTVDQHKCTTIQ